MLRKLFRNNKISAKNREIEKEPNTAATSSSENLRKLNSCKKPHDFQIPIRGIWGFARSWCCTICDGEVSNEARTWYIQGLTHGRRENDKSYPDLPVDAPRGTSPDARVGSTQTSRAAKAADHLLRTVDDSRPLICLFSR